MIVHHHPTRGVAAVVLLNMSCCESTVTYVYMIDVAVATLSLSARLGQERRQKLDEKRRELASALGL